LIRFWKIGVRVRVTTVLYGCVRSDKGHLRTVVDFVFYQMKPPMA